MKVKRKAVKLKVKDNAQYNTVEHSVKSEEVEERYEEDDSTIVDMTGWEDRFDFESMRGLFFIQKGQYRKGGLKVTVKDGKEYEDRDLGGYNPYDPNTLQRYIVYDKVTFNSICSVGTLEQALNCITNHIVRYENDPERYFREVCEVTNEDFYFRHYLGRPPFTDIQLRKRRAEGRSWRQSPHMKRMCYAVQTQYGDFFSDDVEEAEEKALSLLEEKRRERKERHRKMRKRFTRVKRKVI